MKKLHIIFFIACVVGVISCNHKELCYDHPEHALRYHINVVADYRYAWEEFGAKDWKSEWPEEYIPYEDFLPTKPSGLRVVNFNEMDESNIHNISADGGVVGLYEGNNDILFYNNDTEYIVFTRPGTGATTRATTRTRTRASYTGYAGERNEVTVTPPDMLYANFINDYIPEKLSTPTDLEVTLQPLVFTYLIRYEFESGMEYMALTRGALTGMAQSVLMNTGATSDEAATILYDCETTDFGSQAIVKSFGVPSYPNSNYRAGATPKHILNLEILLRNGKIAVHEFDVTDQVQAQPHGGVIVVKGITITEEEGMQGSGAFDVTVNGWGEYEDIELPM